ncbi:hypothetical protein HYX00_02115, partial [Candidatus Woesearchaeota archaeon]|nr:hypothetical protein [Candidatus Woesearchaeota archaeon]
TVYITNKGKNVERGELSCYILEHSDVSNFPAEDKNFKDYQHFQINNFDHGKKIKYKCKIESRFIKPASYMVKLIISKFERVDESQYDTLLGILRKTYKNDVNKINLTIAEIEKTIEKNLPLHLSREIQKNTFHVVPLINFRWLEVLKIHPISTLATFLGVFTALVGILIAVFISKK